jgi:hypothetical protein
MLRRREDKGGPGQLLFPIAKPQDWLEKGNCNRQRKCENTGLIVGKDRLLSSVT